MRYTFYELDDASYQKVEPLTKEMAQITRSLFCTRDIDRVAVIRQKNQLSKEINKIVLEQRIFGYVDEKEFQECNIKALKKTVVSKIELDDILFELINSKGKLYTIVKKATVANKNIYIMVEDDDK